MGLLRLYFAVLIVLAHLNNPWGIPVPFVHLLPSGDRQSIGRVHIFFLQSGFLTQLQFMAGRMERMPVGMYYWRRIRSIYPQYYLFLALTIMSYLYFGAGLDYLSRMAGHGISPMEIAVANLTALNLPSFSLWNISRDWDSFFILAIAPAWSLTMQLGFILLAPWVLNSTRRLAIVTAVCTASMLFYYSMGWWKLLIATELAYFWFGAWTAHLARKLGDRGFGPGAGKLIILAAVLLPWFFTPVANHIGEWPTFFFFHLFAATAMIPAWRSSRRFATADRFFSSMAFTMYLCHFLVALICQQMVGPGTWTGLYALGAVLVVAVLVNVPQLWKSRLWQKPPDSASPAASPEG